MRYVPLFLTAVLLGFGPCAANAADAAAPSAPPDATSTSAPKTFSDSERAGIEAIVKEYLTKEHPEIIMEAAQELQRRAGEIAETKSVEAVAKNKDQLYNDAATPSSGDPKSDVTIVEFFDYQCGYCKMAEPGLEKLMSEDKKLKVIFKEYPILGPGSIEAAKASLASMKQGKFLKFHEALISKKEHVTDAVIADAAKEAGLDGGKLKKDAEDPSVQKEIDDSIKLGSEIGVRGTPMFVINDQVYPGAMQYDQLKKAVEEARAGAKKS